MARQLVLLCLLVPAMAQAALTQPSADLISDLRGAVAEIIEDEPALGPKFVRLSFHDCVGGCDGCVDLANGENAGLGAPIDALERLLTPELSRADLWALAGLTAARVAQRDAETDNVFAFVKWGRQDCGDDPKAGPDRTLPSANLATDGVLDFFEQQFGFNAQQTVALMGAHTLGGTTRANSGFTGNWTPDDNQLDSDYYLQLLRPWSQQMIDNSNLNEIPDRFAWRRGGGGGGGGGGGRGRRLMQRGGRGPRPGRPGNGGGGGNRGLVMLNADIALVRDFNGFLDPASGEVTCSFNGNNRCPDAATLQQVQRYRNNNRQWVEDFEAVFSMMLETVPAGNPTLIDV